MSRFRPALVCAVLALTVPAGAAAKPADRDRDRMPDRWERAHGLSVKKHDAGRDGDRDGLRNIAELRSGTHPRRPDSDRDGTLDGQEDRDRDSVDNGNEDRERTSPRKKDSDRDGVRDGREDADRDGLDNHGEDVTGNDPIDPDTDDDGVKDGAEDAGTIVSFEDGVLTVRSARGTSVIAAVTDATEIECSSEGDLELWDEDEDELGARGLDVAGERRITDPFVPDEDGDEDRGGSGKGDDERGGSGKGGKAGDDERGGSGKGGKGGDDEPSDEDPSESDDEDEDSDRGDEDEESCGVEALVRGAGVHEAELVLTADGPVFTKIELVE
jgi:hypothetical protein